MRFSSFVLVVLAFGVVAIGCSNDGGAGGGQQPAWTIDAGALKLLVTDSPWNMTFLDDGTWTSVEADGTWTLTLENDVERTIHLEASTKTLNQPFDVCGVNVGVTALADDAWSYNPETGVLKATYTTTGAPLQTTPC